MALIASIYRSDSQDASNGGISLRVNRVIIVNAEGPADPDHEMYHDIPKVEIIRREYGGRVIFHAEPVEPVPDGYNGYMAGGTFVHSTDSRFREAIGDMYGAISLHDRVEEYRR